MTSDTVMLTIRLPRDLRDAFVEAAQRDDLSASQILRRAIRSYLKESEGGVSQPVRTAPMPAATASQKREAIEETVEAEHDDDVSRFIHGINGMCGLDNEDD